LRSRIKISTVFADDNKEVPVTENEVKTAVELVLSKEGIKEAEITNIFVNDTTIRELNNNYLNHDWYTDVIAFSYEDKEEIIEGEIYISTDTAEIQAKENNVTLKNELLRLVIHGILHLCGYEDDTEEKKREMLGTGEKFLVLINNESGNT
jgi:rRNA maturation RNase YbeY